MYAGTYIQFYFTEEGVVAGTYIPPGPMLNSASTRLACLEDVEIDVTAPGAPQHLFRRRVFAPEDNRDERYLTASDVVKVRLFSSAFFCQPCFVVRLFAAGVTVVHSLTLCLKPHFQKKRLGKDPKTMKHSHGMGGCQLSLFPFTGIAD